MTNTEKPKQNWEEMFDKQFCSFGLNGFDMKDGKPFDGSSVADYCGSADEYIKQFISKLLLTNSEEEYERGFMKGQKNGIEEGRKKMQEEIKRLLAIRETEEDYD